MNRDCITSNQGRAPCTCGLHTANSDGSDPIGDPWDLVSDLRAATLLTLAGVVFAVAVGTVIFWATK